jgi:hypothetical protein
MAMAAGAVVVMQSYSQLQHIQTRDDIKEIHDSYVPRPEISTTMEVNKENLKKVLKDIGDRLTKLETLHLVKETK